MSFIPSTHRFIPLCPQRKRQPIGLSFAFSYLVRIGRIELPTRPWQGRVLPLNHIRYEGHHSTGSAVRSSVLAGVLGRIKGDVLQSAGSRDKHLSRERVHVEVACHGESIRTGIPYGEHIAELGTNHHAINREEVS